MKENIPLMPIKARITETKKMTVSEKFLTIEFQDSLDQENFNYKPGQFIKLGVMGVGEAPISLCTAQTDALDIELCIRNAGRVTNAIHKLKAGDTVWIRGPYGNGFPMEEFTGRNLLLAAGGLGIAPLRGVLQYALKNRDNFGEITFLYGVRNYDLMLFRDEMIDYFRQGDQLELKTYLSYENEMDRVFLDLQREMKTRCIHGMITELFSMLDPQDPDTIAILGGPPIMYRFTVMELEKLGFSPEQIFMTLERRMRCGVGQCGHCVMGTGKSIKYVCKDGPVFTQWDALNTKGMI